MYHNSVAALRVRQASSAVKIQALWRGYRVRCQLAATVDEFEALFLETERAAATDVASRSNGVYRAAIMPRTTLLWRPDAECVCAPPLFLTDAEHWTYMRDWKERTGYVEPESESEPEAEPEPEPLVEEAEIQTVGDGDRHEPAPPSMSTSELLGYEIDVHDRAPMRQIPASLGRELLRTDELAVFALDDKLDYECVVEEGNGQQSMLVSSPARGPVSVRRGMGVGDATGVGTGIDASTPHKSKPKSKGGVMVPRIVQSPVPKIARRKRETEVEAENMGKGPFSYHAMRVSPRLGSGSGAATTTTSRPHESPPAVPSQQSRVEPLSRRRLWMDFQRAGVGAAVPVPVPTSSISSTAKGKARAKAGVGGRGGSPDLDLDLDPLTPQREDWGGGWAGHRVGSRKTSTGPDPGRDQASASGAGADLEGGFGVAEVESLRSELRDLKKMMIAQGQGRKGNGSGRRNVVDVPSLSGVGGSSNAKPKPKPTVNLAGSIARLTPLYDDDDETDSDGEKARDRPQHPQPQPQRHMTREDIEQELLWVKRALVARRAHVRSARGRERRAPRTYAP